ARRLPGDFVIVGVLKGAALFVADLARAFHRAGARPGLEFLWLASYGADKQSSGAVRLLGGMPKGLTGRRVLLVDTIADSGRSLAFAASLLRQNGVGELLTCVLVDKPARRAAEVTIDFVGFTIDDVFVAGYGTDFAEQYRYLPYIGIVE